MGVNRKRGEERGKDREIGIDGEGRGFSEVLNSNSQYALQCQFASSCQISYRSAKPFRRYGRLLIFQNGGRPPSWFSKVGNFNCLCPSEGQNALPCQILCRSVEPSQRYGRFLIFKMAAVRYLGFLNFLNFNHPYPSEVQSASSRQILCKSVKALQRYMSVFDFSRWRPSAILDLL